MSDVKEIRRLTTALDNFDWGINIEDYPINGAAITERLNTLKAWEFLTVEEEAAVINDIKALIKYEPVGEL